MRFLDSENLAEYLVSLFNAGGLEVEGDGITVNWEREADPCDCPNNAGEQPLKRQWRVDDIEGKFNAVFSVPRDWVFDCAGEAFFRLDGETPVKISDFMYDGEVFRTVEKLVIETARGYMERPPTGELADDSLPGFSAVVGDARVVDRGDEKEITVEITVENIAVEWI
jgi:hypothetical protein